MPEVEIFTDGACSGNPGPGGWGAILRSRGVEKELAGAEPATTNNRMELMAAIAGLEALKRPCRVRLYTDSQYLRDGITEDVITELSKIRGLNIFSRPTVLAFRDKPVTPAQVGQQLGAACVLTGTLRRAGARLRINVQLVDTKNPPPLSSASR